MFFIHTVAPPLLHATQRHKQKHAFPTPSPFSRTHTQTNKPIHTQARFAADVKQGQQPLPPNNSPHYRFSEVMLGQHLASPIPPPPHSFQISPSAPTSPFLHLLFPLHTLTRYLAFYCPICPLYTLVIFLNIHISHSSTAYPYRVNC